MKTTNSPSDVIDELTLAEAATWLSRQGEEHPEDMAAFREWLAASPANRRAFERVSDVWDIIPGAAASARRTRVSPPPRRKRRRRILLPACAALLLVVAAFAWTFLPTGHMSQRVYQTAIGQQKTVVLADDTHITLNTDTKIVVDYLRNERRVWLQHGEALFQVKRNTARPFILRTGNQQIIDLGTVFDVRHYAGGVAVTLLEGKVWVGDRKTAPGDIHAATILKPGERLTIQINGKQNLDHPNIDGVTAWRRGQIELMDTTLAKAVARINRYNARPVQLADKDLGSLRVSGVFSAREPADFAAAVARLHDLHVHADGHAIVLTR